MVKKSQTFRTLRRFFVLLRRVVINCIATTPCEWRHVGMPIFVEHWGIICNFTPILPYFQHWGDEPRQQSFSGKQIK